MAVSEAMVAACLRIVKACVEEVRLGLWKRVMGLRGLGCWVLAFLSFFSCWVGR